MIRKKRFQNRVAESRWLLPLTLVVCTAFWWVWHSYTVMNAMAFLCLMLTVWVMVEWNVRFNLLRNYSRMLAAMYALFTTLLSVSVEGYTPYLIQLLLSLSLLLLMGCHDVYRSSGRIFASFTCIGFGSLFFFPLFCFIPLLWCVLAVTMRGMTARALTASVLGCALPYWLFLGLWCCDISLWGDWGIVRLGDWLPVPFLIDFSLWKLSMLSAIVFLLLTAGAGVVHYVRQRFSDKSFVRLMYYAFMSGICICLVLLVLCPHWYSYLSMLLSVFVSPLAAHLFTHTYTRWTNLMFKIWLCALLTLFVLGGGVWKM